MSKRKTFSREFKLEAVRMMESGKKQATEIARELGIPRSRLYLWREQLRKNGGEGAFPGHGRRAGQAAEFDALKRENERLHEENDILKKAARYFAKESS
jgi:transposase-like protein